MLTYKDIDRSIPITLLADWLNAQSKAKTDEHITDCVAALGYIKTNDTLLQEKAVASIAIRNNRASIWDLHGFSNIVLMSNNIPASADYVASADPAFVNYTVWELTQDDPGLIVGPSTWNYIISNLKAYDYVFPPAELGNTEGHFLALYGERAEAIKLVYEKITKDSSEKLDIFEKLDKLTEGTPEELGTFVKFHVTRLLAADDYLRRMQAVYFEWKLKMET